MTHPTGRLALAAVLVVLAGCGGGSSPAETRTALEESRTAMRTLVQDVAKTLGSAGLDVAELSGAYRTCRSEPSPGLSYVAGGATAGLGNGPAEPRLAEVRGALEVDGWTITASKRTVLSAERDGTTVSVGQTMRAGSPVVAFDSNGECVAADSNETDALLGETESIPVD